MQKIENRATRLTRIGGALCAMLFAASVFAQVPGSLHTTPLPAFASGNGKLSALDISNNQDRANAIALQSDGKIVLAGHCYVPNDLRFCAMRLDANGALDNSFDSDGFTSFTIGSGDASGYAVAIQPDGKIVIAGSCTGSQFRDFCIARLNGDGSLDDSFDGESGTANGKFILTVGNGSHAAVNAMAIQADGKIVVAGGCGQNSINNFCAARLLPDGKYDTSFGGIAGFNFIGVGRTRLSSLGYGGAVNALALQPDGRIVLAGQCRNGAGNEDFCVARINADGSADEDFDGSPPGNGVLTFPMGSADDIATAVAIQPDGRIVVAGHCESGATSDMCMIRLEASGTLDPHFDGPTGTGNGKLMLSTIGTGSEGAYAMLLQPDGKIVLVGDCGPDFCVARLHSDGALDQSFDGPSGSGNGWFALAMGSSTDRARAAAIQSDGRILVAGFCVNTNEDFCIARLNGGPFAATRCLMDLDGDGAISATTDVLILARIALGIRGDAVVADIGFTAQATRNSWASIRAYLVSQCAMDVY